MTGSKKKGLSIGAAMKQRMDSQDQQAEPPVQERESSSNKSSGVEEAVTTVPPADPMEAEILESFNTRLPRGLHRRLKVHTAVEGHKIQEVVARALDDYLKQFEKKDL